MLPVFAFLTFPFGGSALPQSHQQRGFRTYRSSSSILDTQLSWMLYQQALRVTSATGKTCYIRRLYDYGKSRYSLLPLAS